VNATRKSLGGGKQGTNVVDPGRKKVRFSPLGEVSGFDGETGNYIAKTIIPEADPGMARKENA